MNNYTLEEIFALFLSMLCCSSPVFIVIGVIIITVLVVVFTSKKNNNKNKQPNYKAPPTVPQKITYQPTNRYYVKQVSSVVTNVPRSPVTPYTPPSQQEPKEEYRNEYEEEPVYPYCKKRLLSKHELQFYKELKLVADSKNLCVLSKIRMADLVNVNGYNYSDQYVYFNKVSRKHVDFALAEPQNLNIVLLIELDDSSHDYEQSERDRFVENVYKKTGYKLLRVRNAVSLNEKITAILDEVQ